MLATTVIVLVKMKGEQAGVTPCGSSLGNIVFLKDCFLVVFAFSF